MNLFNPKPNVLGIYKKILVPPNLLPPNELLVCANGGMTFDNGMLLCPLIYRKELNQWLLENDKTDQIMNYDYNTYPIMRAYREQMDVWGEFINECIPLEWHIEVFEKSAWSYYTLLRFIP